MALMNVMYSMIQFVDGIPVPDETSDTLAINFMQHALMKFEIFHLVVLNNDTPIKGRSLLCARL